MKKNQLFIVFATVITITTANELYGMVDRIKEKLYKSIEKPIIYHSGVYTIDKTAQLLSNTAFRLAYITGKKDILLKKIDNRLAHIEQKLKDDEVNAINGIYQEFNIGKEDQKTINSIIYQYKEFAKQYLSQSHKKECDTLELASPETLSFCEHINIHPSAIELKVSHSPSPFIAQATGLKANYQFENDNLIIEIDDIIEYPAIVLNPAFFELSYEEEVGNLAHELTHHALQHETMLNILGMEIKYFTERQKKEITSSKNWKKLETICERQADILLKDAEWISIMRKKRHQGYYPDHLFLNHYAQLTEIDELHKLKAKINPSA